MERQRALEMGCSSERGVCAKFQDPCRHSRSRGECGWARSMLREKIWEFSASDQRQQDSHLGGVMSPGTTNTNKRQYWHHSRMPESQKQRQKLKRSKKKGQFNESNGGWPMTECFQSQENRSKIWGWSSMFECLLSCSRLVPVPALKNRWWWWWW